MTAISRTTGTDAEFEAVHGYVPCGCRDCFDIAIGPLGTLCLLCADAECEPNDGECERDDAYGEE